MSKSSQPPLYSSLAVLIALVLSIVLIISIISLVLFWQSPTRQLAIDIQTAADDLYYIQDEINQSVDTLNAEFDFKLHNEEDILLLLEF